MARSTFSDQQTVKEAIRRVRDSLSSKTQSHFDLIVSALRHHLTGRSARFDAPYSRRWFTVKLVPTKAIIAFRSKDGVLEFDIDTYPESGRDITDEETMFDVRPNPDKPNKVYVAEINDDTPARSVCYFISKMFEAIDIFEPTQSKAIFSRTKGV